MKYISTPSEELKQKHFAALVFSSVYIPKQGVWAKAQGYPAENKPIVEYIAFESKVEMEEWVLRQDRYQDKKQYQLIESTPLVVNKSVSISIQ